MPTILGANSVSGYDVENSLRFNDGSTEKLTRTNSSGGNRQIFTHSFWFKRATPGNIDVLFQVGTSTSTNTGFYTVTINGSDKLFIGGAASSYRQTDRLFRDPAAWYHIVLAMDTTDGTADNRLKVYVNGSQETSFTTNNTISQNLNTPVNENSKVHQISGNQQANDYYAAGYLSEFNHIDGQQLDPSYFGETNDNGVWVPKKYTGTYGTNGFFLEFQQTGTSANSSGMGADTSGNDNHYAATNLAAIDVTTDTPTNNFATWNPLDADLAAAPTITEGNTQLAQPQSGGSTNCNFGVSQGKWYVEAKITDRSNIWLGIVPQNLYPAGTDLFTKNYTIGIYAGNPNLYQNGSSQGSLGGGLSDDDIVMYAIDLDNNLFYIGKNGQWNDGLGGGFDQSAFADANGFSFNRSGTEFYVIGTVNGSGSSNYVVQMNFGNPAFSISSSNNDGKYGNFEYAVPSGYYALCTKRLAEFG